MPLIYWGGCGVALVVGVFLIGFGIAEILEAQRRLRGIRQRWPKDPRTGRCQHAYAWDPAVKQMVCAHCNDPMPSDYYRSSRAA